jgi:tetratricopeptide (TPR) repeat protein
LVIVTSYASLAKDSIDSLRYESIKQPTDIVLASFLAEKSSNKGKDTFDFYIKKAIRICKTEKDSCVLLPQIAKWYIFNSQLDSSLYIIELNKTLCKKNKLDLYYYKTLLVDMYRLMLLGIMSEALLVSNQIDSNFNLHKKDIEWKRLRVSQLYFLTNIYINQGKDYAKAIEIINEGSELALETNNKGIISSFLMAESAIYHQLYEDEKAVSILYKSIDIAKEYNDLKNLGIIYSNIGQSFSMLKKYDSANKYFKLNLKLLEKSPNKLSEAFCYKEMGVTYYELNKIDSAKIFLQKAFDNYNQLGNKDQYADIKYYLGSIAFKEGAFAKAEKLLNESYILFKEDEYYTQMDDCLLKLIEINKNSTDKQKLLNLYKEYVMVKDSALNEDKLGEMERKKAMFQLKQKDDEISLKQQNVDRIKQQNFYLLTSSLLLLGLIGSLFYGFRKKAKNMNLKSEKEQLSYKLESLRAKFTTHFSGNVYNALVFLIEQKKYDEAIDYLLKFSKLNADVIRNADKASRSLRDELKLVNDYLQLEKLRYNEKLQYSIKVDDNINQDIEIPLMLLHTFAENAIKHGFMSKKGYGHLDIRIYSKETNGITIHIEDDGIGREEAKQYNLDSTKVGLSTLKKQIELSNHQNETPISIDIVDRMINGFVNGTICTIFIPYHYTYML